MFGPAQDQGRKSDQLGNDGFHARSSHLRRGPLRVASASDNPSRLVSHQIRVADGLIRAAYEDALDQAANSLKSYSGSQFAMVAPASATREELYVLRKFTKEVMKSDLFVVEMTAFSVPEAGQDREGALLSRATTSEGTRPA